MPGDDDESTGLLSRFSFDKPVLWFARARLQDDAIVLAGWQLTGRYRRRIPLHKITQVDVPGSNRLLLWLTSGRTVQLRLPEAARWKRAIRRRQVEADEMA